MKWEELKGRRNSEFRRLTGVNRGVFEMMLEVVSEAKAARRRHPSRGVKPKLCDEDQLLLTLMYYREYRDLLHVGVAYGMSESQTCRIIADIEKLLIADNRFHLPGRKSLHGPGPEFTIIDVSEHPIERPQKSKGVITQAKRRDTL